MSQPSFFDWACDQLGHQRLPEAKPVQVRHPITGEIVPAGSFELSAAEWAVLLEERSRRRRPQ